MVIRESVKCTTCNALYTVRIGMGTERYELHSFDCQECGLPISVALKEHPPTAMVIPEENAELTEEEGGVTINLHGSFAFTVDEYHDRYAFPSTRYLHQILPHMRSSSQGGIQDVAKLFDIPNASFLWGQVKGIVLLSSQPGQNKKMQRLISTYNAQRKKYFPDTNVKDKVSACFNFFDGLFYPKFCKLYDPPHRILLNQINSGSDEFKCFIIFYKMELRQENLNRYLSLFSDYFRIRSELNQMQLFARIDDPHTFDKVVGSKNFEVVKLFYGQAYETLTSHFVMFACLNNILCGRRFDEFKSMTLKKYINDLEKAKKANPFKDNDAFSPYAKYLDSSLRNGSHHASFWRDGEIIRYRSGGTGSEQEIPYCHYLYLCNELVIANAALFVLEMLLPE